MGSKNPYLQVLEQASADRASHHARAAAQTMDHYQRNPLCRRIILSMDKDGNVVRGKREIDIAARCRPNWFTPDMRKGNLTTVQRPVENNDVIETVWIETKPGRVVEANTLMRQYLDELHRVTVVSPAVVIQPQPIREKSVKRPIIGAAVSPIVVK